MEFKWSINKLTVVEDNLVVKVDLTITGTDGDLSASAAYTRTLTRGDSFVSYGQLTEQQVLAWCFAPEVVTWTDKDDVEQSVTRHLQEYAEAQVIGQIASQLAQKQSEPALPWTQIPA